MKQYSIRFIGRNAYISDADGRSTPILSIDFKSVQPNRPNGTTLDDDYPFGGFAGMVMKIEPIDRCISALKAEREYDEIIFTSPDGEQFNQPMANSLSLAKNLIILCGHFKGIDYRIREHFITKEISIGDYVLTGGELAAAVIADAVVRIIPGVISDEQSALSDSFQDNLLAAPVYTRPAEYKGWQVPDVLLSGHEAKIKEWELQQSLERTQRLRPDLLK